MDNPKTFLIFVPNKEPRIYNLKIEKMAKTYAQVEGGQVVDWKKELQSLIDGKESTVDLELGKRWSTCYVGQQSELISRNDDGTPCDGWVRSLGNNFSERVESEDYSEALNICEMIDVRIAFLLKDKKAKMLVEIEETQAKLKKLNAELKKF